MQVYHHPRLEENLGNQNAHETRLGVILTGGRYPPAFSPQQFVLRGLHKLHRPQCSLRNNNAALSKLPNSNFSESVADTVIPDHQCLPTNPLRVRLLQTFRFKEPNSKSTRQVSPPMPLYRRNQIQFLLLRLPHIFVSSIESKAAEISPIWSETSFLK